MWLQGEQSRRYDHALFVSYYRLMATNGDQGDGSYSNPETFATAQSNTDFKNCDVVYIPYFRKYFQYLDHCVQCGMF